MTIQKELQHLFNRAGFGLSPQEVQSGAFPNRQTALDYLFSYNTNPRPLAPNYPVPIKDKSMTDKEKGQQRREQQRIVKMIGVDWIVNMGKDSQNVLAEHMSLFWHGHFACRTKVAFLAAQQLDSIRKNALGNFRELVSAIAKDPSMIRYLNNQQNRKDRPNENFARELMELFTIGRGNYTETDVKQAARAFTGWFSNKKGEFNFREDRHDFGKKTFMGKTGKFDGTDIINIILERKETAVFIVSKLYRYFVNEQVNPEHIGQLAMLFYDSDYDIKELMYAMFSSDWFYDAKNIGIKIKSPVELVAGMIRQAGLEVSDSKSLYLLQKSLSQKLFDPPNVAGWPGGKTWIDNSTMLTRTNLPLNIYTEQNENAGTVKGRKKLNATYSFDGLEEMTQGLSEEETIRKLADYLFVIPLQMQATVLKNFIQADNSREFVKQVCVRLMSLPEYQMC
jgi:uncharacterized protein (DUF1800 family)